MPPPESAGSSTKHGAVSVIVWSRDVKCLFGNVGPAGGVLHQGRVPNGTSAQPCVDHRRLGVPSIRGFAQGSRAPSDGALHPGVL